MRRRLVAIVLALSLILVGFAGCDSIDVDMMPAADNTYDIGRPGLSWAEIHAYDYYMYGNMQTDLDPAGAGVFDSGDAVDYWHNVYAETFWAGASVSISTDGNNNIVFDGYNIPRTATFVVAASDSSPQSKAQADYVCVGTADDEIQAAIDALPVNGGKVLLLEGNYLFNDSIYVIIDNLTLLGQGRSTILKLDDLTQKNIIDVNTVNGLQILDIAFDGNESGQNVAWAHKNGGDETKCNPIFILSSNDVLISRVYVYESLNVGILFKDNCDNVHVRDSYVTGCEWHGIEFWGNISYGIIEGNYVSDCYVQGIVVELPSSNCVVDGNIVVGRADGTDDHGILLQSNTEPNVVSNNSIYDGRIYVNNAPGSLIIGNIIQGNVASGNQAGIEVEGTSDYSIIVGNYIFEGQVDPAIQVKGDNCLIASNYIKDTAAATTNISNSGDWCNIVGNSIQGGTGNGISNSGDYCVISGNVIESCGAVALYGIYSSGEGSNIKGNVLRNVTGTAAIAIADDYQTVEGNIIDNTTGTGIYVLSGGNDYTKILGNTVTNGSSNGIRTNGGFYTSIINNLVDGNATNGIYTNTVRTMIRGNTVTNNTSDGVEFHPAASLGVVSENYFAGNGGVAIKEGGTNPSTRDNIGYEDSTVKISYGELYETNELGTTINCVVSGTYYQWVTATVGLTSGGNLVVGSAATDSLTIGSLGDGVYLVNFHCSFNGNNNTRYHTAIFLNGVRQTKLEVNRKIGAGLDVGAIAITGLITLSSGDVLTVWVATDANNSTYVIEHLDFNITRVGD